MNRLAEAGLSDRADVKLIDYRDLNGKFDHPSKCSRLSAGLLGTYFRPFPRC